MDLKVMLEGIKDLPEDIREVIDLYYNKANSKKDIAIQMNFSQTAVRSKIAKGLYLLKKKMGEKGVLEAQSLIYPQKKGGSEGTGRHANHKKY